jgi:hypothetical protein
MKHVYFSVFKDLKYTGAKSKEELWEAVAHRVKDHQFTKVNFDNHIWIKNTLLRFINTVDLAEWRAGGNEREKWEPPIQDLSVYWDGDSTDGEDESDDSDDNGEEEVDDDERKGADEHYLAKISVEIPKSKGESESREGQ